MFLVLKMATEKAKVLIVDDDPLVAQDLSDELSFSGKYKPFVATSGDEAVRTYKLHNDLRLVILDTDLNPTNEKGWEVYDRLRGVGYQGPALARSARGNRPEWQGRSIEFLDKAVRMAELEATVNRLVESYPVK